MKKKFKKKNSAKKKIPGKKNKIPGNEKKFRFLGIFMNIPYFSKFRRNIPAKKFKKFRRNFRKFRAGIPSFSDTPYDQHNTKKFDPDVI